MSVPVHGRRRRLLVCGLLTASLVVTAGAGVTWADHDADGTVHVCVNTAGVVREALSCRADEQAYVLVTEGGLAGLASDLRSRLDALVGADETITARLDELESGANDMDARLAAVETQNSSLGTRVEALEAVDVSLGDRLSALESRVAALELAVSRPVVTFTKIYDGGHYASYNVTGSGFKPGSTVTSGVGINATVSDDGTFSLFGGNLFCDDEASVTGTDVNDEAVSRSTPVVCDSEAVSAATVAFTKIHDGGHYASYEATGTGFRAGSTVTSGVGTTATVNADGTFTLFGGNLFCDDQVSVSGVDASGNSVSRFAEVVCENES